MEEFSLFDHCVMLSYNDDVRERCLSFSCGDADLDDFFHNDAERYAEELMGKTYCWVTEEKPWWMLIIILVRSVFTNGTIFVSCIRTRLKNVPIIRFRLMRQ